MNISEKFPLAIRAEREGKNTLILREVLPNVAVKPKCFSIESMSVFIV